MKRWLRQSLWVLALALVGVLATGAQLDRAARYRPELAPLVPGPFRAFSQHHLASASLSGGTTNEALREARRLVERRPIPAEHLSLLAHAQLREDADGPGLTTMQLAAQRGWRDPAAQEARLRLAIAVGDGREAALRLAAIWALARDDATLRELAPPVLAHEQARQAMAELLASQPRWVKSFRLRGPRVLDRAVLDDVVARAQAAASRTNQSLPGGT